MAGHASSKITKPATFDPNALVPGEMVSPEDRGKRAQFPSFEGTMSVADYADAFLTMGLSTHLMSGGGGLGKSEPFSEIAKVMGVAGMADAPEFQTYAKMSNMPNAFNRGLAQWPDLPAATLRKIADENYIVNTVIQQRVSDITRYSAPSNAPWKPGWAIEMRDGRAQPIASDLKDIADATRFVMNCNSLYGWDARERDKHGLTPFQGFLASTVRDTYRYDQIAWWTDMDLKGRVRQFKAVPAGNVLRATRDGYENKKDIWACGVDEVGTVKHEFTRNELTLITRNPRTDGDIYGYGFAEICMAIRLIQGFTNAFDMNADIFTKDSIPPGLLKLKGMWGQRQVEAMTRIWGNLKRGASKKWAFPAIPIPRDGDIELLDLSRMTDNDMYYADFCNMFAGLFCSLFAFPPNRLGYRISGKNQPTEQKDAQSPMTTVDEIDPGLPTLLFTIQNAFNQYIMQTIWPHLIFVFRGVSPKEDARQYADRKEAATFNEMRALADYGPYENEFDDEHKEIAILMGRAPVSPNLAGIWQNLCTAFISAKYGKESSEGGPKGEMTAQKDAAASEGHGHQAGIRRDSKSE
jgi:hypothetical protein